MGPPCSQAEVSLRASHRESRPTHWWLPGKQACLRATSSSSCSEASQSSLGGAAVMVDTRIQHDSLKQNIKSLRMLIKAQVNTVEKYGLKCELASVRKQ